MDDEAARTAILAAIERLAKETESNNGAGAVSAAANAVRDLAEAYAWLTVPAQAH